MSRQEILRVARDLCRVGGPSNVTMRQIGLGAGMNATSVYRHFRGKADLLRAVARDAVNELERSLLGISSTGDPRHALLAMCHTYLAFAFSEPWLYRLPFQEADTGGRAEAVDRVALAFARESSRLVGGDGRDAALMLVAMLHGIATLSMRFGEHGRDLDWPGVEMALERIVSGLCVAEAEPEQRAG